MNARTTQTAISLICALSAMSLSGCAKLTCEPWYALGPFYNTTFEAVIGPENGPDLSKVYKQDTPFDYKWKLHPEWKDGQSLDLNLPPNSCMYFYRIATASAAANLDFTVGTADGIKLWLNTEPILSRYELGNQQTETVNANLRKGNNEILMKIFNKSSPSKLYFKN
jgi:hypothetical protein